MKSMKKILALLLAVVMIAAMLAVPAFAEETTNKGTITIENATANQTYAGYKIFDATYNETNDVVSYTIKSNSPWYAKVSGAEVEVEGTSKKVFTLNEIESLESDTVKTFSVVVNDGVGADAVLAVFFTALLTNCV